MKLRVCQEIIYRYIYSKEGMAQELWWYLLAHRKSRRPRRARKRLPPKFDRGYILNWVLQILCLTENKDNVKWRIPGRIGLCVRVDASGTLVSASP